MSEGSWVGLDVHARSVVAGVIDGVSGEVRSLRVPPGCDQTVAWLQTLPAPVRVVYEAGPTGYRLARACAEARIGCVVAAPSRVRAAADRVKTDRRDAERLARLLRLGEITPVRIPTLEEEAARDLVRAREDARGDLMRARHRLSKLLLRHGLLYDATAWTRAHDVWLRRQRFDGGPLAIVFDECYGRMLDAKSRRDALDKAIQLKALLVLAGVLAVVATASLSVASATTHKPVVVPPDAVLTWNTYAVNAVRASTPTKVQTDGMVYMSYVQAAVYDAVTKLEGRYVPYHVFSVAVVPGASVQAAVAAATQTILDHYLPDQQPTVDAEYTAYIATLTGDVAGGVTVGQAAAQDIIAFRSGDGLNAATPSYGEIGPILPGQWQLQPGQKVQTPWVATMRPFLLERASQFRAEPPPALTSHQYAKDLNETEAYGALNSTVRTPEQTAIAYFWVGNNINQYNQTMQNVVAQHGMDLVDAAHLLAMGEIVTTDAGIACYDSKFFYLAWRPITAIQNADKDGNPDTTADPAWQSLLPVPGHPEYPSQHGCFTAAFTDTLAAALHTNHLDVTMPGGQNGSSVLTTTQHFNTVADIQAQVVDARVWLGFHFRNSVEQGETLGNNVADFLLTRYFGPA